LSGLEDGDRAATKYHFLSALKRRSFKNNFNGVTPGAKGDSSQAATELFRIREKQNSGDAVRVSGLFQNFHLCCFFSMRDI
jgi:hypothetical protein